MQSRPFFPLITNQNSSFWEELPKTELSKTDCGKRRIQTQQEIDQFLITIQIKMCLTQIIVIVIDI